MPLYVANREELELMIVTMHAQGWTIRALCRHSKIGRNTVRRILRKNNRQRQDLPETIPPPRNADTVDNPFGQNGFLLIMAIRFLSVGATVV